MPTSADISGFVFADVSTGWAINTLADNISRNLHFYRYLQFSGTYCLLQIEDIIDMDRLWPLKKMFRLPQKTYSRKYMTKTHLPNLFP